MLLLTLFLGAKKILCHIARYEIPTKGKFFFAYSTNLWDFSKRSEIDTFIPVSFNRISSHFFDINVNKKHFFGKILNKLKY